MWRLSIRAPFVMSVLALLSGPSLIPPAKAQNPIALPPGQAGKVYSAQVNTEGGLAPFTWDVASGRLPAGLGLSNSGKIEGTPTSARLDPYVFSLKVSDSSQPAQTAVMQFSLPIQAGPLRITGVSTGVALKITGVNASGASSSDPASPAVGGSPQQSDPTTPTGLVTVAASNKEKGQPPANTDDPKPAESTPAKVQPAAKGNSSSCSSASPAYLPQMPVAGQKVVSGCAGSAPVRVVVYQYQQAAAPPPVFPDFGSCPADPSSSSQAGFKPVDSRPANVNLETGIFEAELSTPLVDSELICIYPAGTSPGPPIVVNKWRYNESTQPWGRTHYYLDSGIEMSQDNQQFSNQDLFLGFSLDRNWRRGAPNSHFSALFNSEFSAQLSSIPVAASSTTTTSSTTSTPTTTSTSTSSTPSLNTFMSSRKAAVVDGAIYAPLYTDAFKGWFGSQTTAFVAPILKGGLQSITSGSFSSTTPAPGTTTTSATVNGAGLYYFWGAGLRLGEMKLSSSWNIAPRLLSHLDLTVGQWQNFKQCRTSSNCTPASDGTVPPSQLYQPVLFALEGQIDIPKTPALIGFKSITPLTGGGQGDLRFFFGLKLDIGCMVNSLKGNSTTSFFQCSDDQTGTSSSTGSANSGAGHNSNPTGNGQTQSPAPTNNGQTVTKNNQQ